MKDFIIHASKGGFDRFEDTDGMGEKSFDTFVSSDGACKRCFDNFGRTAINCGERRVPTILEGLKVWVGGV